MPPSTNRSRIPPLLEPYLHLPNELSLILITGVLNASANWLVVKYLSTLLTDNVATNGHRFGKNTSTEPEKSGVLENERRKVHEEASEVQGAPAPKSGNEGLDAGVNDEYGVVLVGFMRDWEFWSTEGRKIGVCDQE